MKNGGIYVSELSASRHVFNNYHFCRGNSSKRKTRIGIILKGKGTYIYLSKKLSVAKGDVVFIPENIYCYSEWHGDPEIEVVYVNCFIHYDSFSYEPQVIKGEEWLSDSILHISELLNMGMSEMLEAYSCFYQLLKAVLPLMVKSDVNFDKTLQAAIEYITENWNSNFSVSELAIKCCVSESTLYHLFQKELGQTPIRFLNSIRINVAMEYLENTPYSVATISRMVAFNSENHFRKVFFECTGTSPLKFRKNK